MTKPNLMNGKLKLSILFLLISGFGALAQTEIEADFSQDSYPPLIKTKFNVYQTPLAPQQRWERDMPLLKELQIRALRFETAWGKGIDFNAPSITGKYPDFNYNRQVYTQFVEQVREQDVSLLLTHSYTPTPLMPGNDWREPPNNMEAWHKINKEYAVYWRENNIRPIDYEVWNEPDLHIFFKGTKEDYFEIYKYGSKGIREGDPDSKIGGPVTAFSAWYPDFLNFVKANELPLDFLSGHAYANAPEQLDSMRHALGRFAWPGVETYMTEYASYTTSPNTDIAEGGAQEQYVAAADFLQDAKMFLEYTELIKVFWAQWLDVELLSSDGKWHYRPGTDKMGLVDISGKRKALFNGFKAYNMMPVDRKEVSIKGAGAEAFASSDKNNAAILVWNPSNSPSDINISLDKIPFSKGTLKVYRIDSAHSSFYENNTEDELKVTEHQTLSSNTFQWSGKLPSKGVVLLHFTNESGLSESTTNKVAEVVRSYHWFWDRGNSHFADFDDHTWIVRLGMGKDKDTALAQIGVEMAEIPSRLRIVSEVSGLPQNLHEDSMLGFQIDFMDDNGGYVKSVLFYDKGFTANSTLVLPWGKKEKADEIYGVKLGEQEINIEDLAPKNFNGRTLLSFIMRNTGKNSGAKFKVLGEGKKIIPYNGRK